MNIAKNKATKYIEFDRTKIKFWVFIVLAFIIGILVAPKQVYPTKEVPVTKEIVREVPGKTVTKTKEVCSKEADWKALKEIDDQGLQIAAEGFSIVGNIFEAQGNLDFDTAKEEITELNKKTPEMGKVAEKRKEILRRLGY